MELPCQRGEFKLLQKIGEGGMAEVFLAERRGQEGFRSRVALKQLHSSFAMDEYFIRQLVREAKLVGQLQHNNILRVHDLKRIEDEYFIVMEYIDGIDLAQAIYVHQQQGLTFPLSIFFHVALSLCEALEFAHNAQDFDGRPMELIHRDLKPSNVLIHHRGVVKLTDFGIAFVGDGTHTGEVVKGTANYMSPEQAAGAEKLTPASDIFSLGAVFWEMLTLERLVTGSNALSVLHRIQTMNVGLTEIANKGIEPGLRMIILRMLAKKRDLRYQTVSAVLKDLRFVADQMKVDLSPAALRQYCAKITNLARRPDLAQDVEEPGEPRVSTAVIDDAQGSTEIDSLLPTPPRGQPVPDAETTTETRDTGSPDRDQDAVGRTSSVVETSPALARLGEDTTGAVTEPLMARNPLLGEESTEVPSLEEQEDSSRGLPSSMTLATNQLEQELGTGAARSESSNQAGYLELASAAPPEVVSPVAQTDLPPEAAVARRRRV